MENQDHKSGVVAASVPLFSSHKCGFKYSSFPLSNDLPKGTVEIVLISSPQTKR